MYCALDRIDVLAQGPNGELFAALLDHRSSDEIEATPELTVLFALARVINAHEVVTKRGPPTSSVRYLLARGPAPAILRDALTAAGAELHVAGQQEPAAPSAPEAVASLVDTAFRDLAKRAAANVGSRDPAVALRMLEDQTIAAPPRREDDEARYWTRILELAALAGELLRARFGGRWVQTSSSALPFAFQLEGGADGVAEVYPTNRAHKMVDDGTSESLFKLVAAAEEMLRRPPDLATGRLMPSLRTRDSVELDEIVWRPLLDDDAPADVPIVVVGIDGDVTFAMMRREALGPAGRSVDDVLAAALANLADEEVERDVLVDGDRRVIRVTGSFYAAEKLLDRAFMRELAAELGGGALAAAAPARGELLVCGDTDDPVRLAQFGAFARARFEDSGTTQISPRVLRVEDGRVVAFAQSANSDARADPDTLRADTEPAIPGARAAASAAGEAKPGLWRRLFGKSK